MLKLTTDDIKTMGTECAREDHARVARGSEARGMEAHWHDTMVDNIALLPQGYGQDNPVWAFGEAYTAEYNRIAWHASAA